MKRGFLWAGIALVCTWLIPAAHAQVVMRGANDGFPLMLPGNFIMISGEEPITVDMVRELGSSGSEYDAPDLQEGDQILYINGQRVRKWGELEEAYDAIAVDEEVKLGIRRGSDTRIESFIKPSEEQLAASGIQMNRSVSGGGVTATPGGGLSMQMSGSMENMQPWGGILIGEEEGSVKVVFATAPFEGSTMQQGDTIKMINGTAVETVKALIDAFDALDVGAEVKLTLDREGEDVTDTFSKPDPSDMPQMMVRTRTGGGN